MKEATCCNCDLTTHDMVSARAHAKAMGHAVDVEMVRHDGRCLVAVFTPDGRVSKV